MIGWLLAGWHWLYLIVALAAAGGWAVYMLWQHHREAGDYAAELDATTNLPGPVADPMIRAGTGASEDRAYTGPAACRAGELHPQHERVTGPHALLQARHQATAWLAQEHDRQREQEADEFWSGLWRDVTEARAWWQTARWELAA